MRCLSSIFNFTYRQKHARCAVNRRYLPVGGAAGAWPLSLGTPSRSSKLIFAGAGSAKEPRVVVKPMIRPAKMTNTQISSDRVATVRPIGGAEIGRAACGE